MALIQLKTTNKMTELEYNNIDALRASHIKAFIDNPDKHAYELRNPREVTPEHFKLGSAIHMGYYEPLRYKTEYIKYDGVLNETGTPARRKTKDKEYYKLFVEKNKGKEFLDEASRHLVSMAVETLPTLPNKAKIEHTFEKTIEGVECKCRIDMHYQPIHGKNIVGQDLKTTTNAKPESYRWELKKRNTLYGLAFYSLISGITDWEILAFEKSPPFINHTYTITAEDLEPYINGSDTVQGLLGDYGIIKQYAQWKANGMPKQGYGEQTKFSELW